MLCFVLVPGVADVQKPNGQDQRQSNGSRGSQASRWRRQEDAQNNFSLFLHYMGTWAHKY